MRACMHAYSFIAVSSTTPSWNIDSKSWKVCVYSKQQNKGIIGQIQANIDLNLLYQC